MNIIEDMAVVKEIRKGEVLIEIPKSESCDSCAAHGICHQADTPRQHWVRSDLLLEEGDYVRIFLSPALKITSSLIVFLLPVLVMLIFYLIPKFLIHTSENTAILISILSLGLSGLVIYLLDKSWGKKIKFEIIEKLDEFNEEEYEDKVE